MKGAAARRWGRRAAVTLSLCALVLLGAHPLAGAASDIWGNVGPASQLGSGAIADRYPLSHYQLDQHFETISASLTGGVDASGVAPTIAYFLAAVLWALTSFLASILISLFGFAFSLDLLNGSGSSGGAGALGPVSAAIHSIYSNVLGAPWLVLAVAVVGIWAMWKALVQRRYAETAGALALSLIYVVAALFFVAQPAATIGSASQWTNKMSVAFLSISGRGSATDGGQAKDDAARQLFDLLVFKPWVVLQFGGLEHCVAPGTGPGDGDPESVAVRPLSSDPARDAALARRLRAGGEVSADGKICVNNAEKYAPHFLRFGFWTEERDAEYEALDAGDSSKLPAADPARAGYRLGAADRPASDAMEEGGQYQRLLIAIVVFVGEMGAFCLLGSLAVGIVLAQILLLLLLAFAPVALVAAVIPGRGHDFFKGWLEKLAGYLLRKAAYSLILAILLAVNGALASATEQLGWLMSFGLQALFFWAVFLQRKSLSQSLVGIATGAGSPGREGALRVLTLYAGARMAARPLRGMRRAAGGAISAPGRLAGGVASRVGGGKDARASGPGAPPPRFGTTYSAPVGSGAPSLDAPGPTERPAAASPDADGPSAARRASKAAKGKPAPAKTADTQAQAGGGKQAVDRSQGHQPSQSPQRSDPTHGQAVTVDSESLGAELRQDRERRPKRPPRPSSDLPKPSPTSKPAASRPKRKRKWRRGRGR